MWINFGVITGYGAKEAVLYIGIPIMGGGMGAGAVPLAKIFGGGMGKSATEMLSIMVPVRNEKLVPHPFNLVMSIKDLGVTEDMLNGR